MATVNYTAKRSLIPGHTIDVNFDLDLRLGDLSRTRAPKKSVARSQGGASETVYERADVIWNCATAIYVDGTALDALKEFLDSTESGENFQWSKYGKAGDSPDLSIPARLHSNGYTEKRVQKKGGGGAGDGYRLTFQIIEA